VEVAAPLAGDNMSLDDDAVSRDSRPGLPDALSALQAVSSSLGSTRQDLATFVGRLTATIAEQSGARRAAFWRLAPRATLLLQRAPFGFADDSRIHQARLPLGARGVGPLERLVFADEVELLDGTSPRLDVIWRKAGLTDTSNSTAVAWRAGERRLGAVAVYDSPDGFTARDLVVLRMMGMTAGILWQCKEFEDALVDTSARLEEATAARRHLLNNIAAGGDEARRRFASALHDDALQLLTGAGLQLERMRAVANGRPTVASFDELRGTLRKVEDSLRRLLTSVSPEPLPLPRDVRAAISERLESVRLRAGIETHNDTRLPDSIPPAIQAIVLKNIGEALTNVEKHARATRVTVAGQAVDGGIQIAVSDNGRGFVEAESARVPGHIGLVALRERALLAGGWCLVTSDPGNGTRVEFWVPLTL
jgi:signal transduction histidine kinase